MWGGLWKLAAMTAVIAAGVVVVWKAQQGMSPEGAVPVQLAENTADPLADVPTAEQLLVGAGAPASAADRGSRALIPPRRTANAAVASVPPEGTDAHDAPPAQADAAPIARGIDFRQEVAATGAEEERPASPSQNAEPTLTLNPLPRGDDQFAGAAPQDDGPTTPPRRLPEMNLATELQTDAAASGPDLQLVGGQTETDAAADPFAGTAPPQLRDAPEEKLETQPDAKKEPTPPFSSKNAAASEPPPQEEPFDPFGAAPPPSRKPPTPKGEDPSTNSPPAEEPFDPFGTAPPPLKQKAPSAAQDAPTRVPARLPTEVDVPAVTPFPSTTATTTRARSETLPRVSPAAPPDEKIPLPELGAPAPLPGSQSVPARSPAPTASPRAAASEPKPDPAPADDSLLGDGTLTETAPRGVQEPRLVFEKLAPTKAVLGQPLIYSVIVKNVGGSAASDVVVEDRIPKGTQLVGTSPRAELTEKRLLWRLGTLKPNDERKISIKVIPQEEGPIGSVAKVSFVAEVAAEIVVTAPQLKVRVQSPKEVKLGDVAELVFTVSNTGKGDAFNVVLRSLIPAGFQHPAGEDLEYAIGKLPAQESREVRLELTAAKPGPQQQKVFVTADGNVSAEAEASLEVVGDQLVLTRTGQSRVLVGRPTTVTNRVGNEGPKPVTKVKVSEVVPAGFEFVEATSGGHFDPATRTIHWTVGPVAPGAEAAVSATILPKKVGSYDATVTAAGPAGGVATVQPKVAIEGYPNLALEPLGENRLVSVGERVTSKVQLKNKGTGAAKQVALAIDLPAELRLVSAKGPGSHRVEGQRLVFETVEQLPPQEVASYELVLEAVAVGDSRLELQIAAEHLRRPLRHEEAVQILAEDQ